MTRDRPWLDEIVVRPLVERGLEARFPLALGDRPLVEAGATVVPGDPLLEHLRDRRVEEVSARTVDVDAPTGSAGWSAGDRWTPHPAGRYRGPGDAEGELLARVPGQRDRWRVVVGDHRDPLLAPVGGTVVEVRPGAEVRVRVDGLAIRAALAAGSPARGRLVLATDPFGELRPGGIDVGRAGSILVVGSRIDAEALTRARAMGVRGILVASLSGKDLRDFQASERRQRAALHPVPPFGVLALDGAIRRPLAGPIAALLERLAGREVSIVTDPPGLVFEAEPGELPAVDPDWVRVRSGPNAGAEGRVTGPAGLRRFALDVQLEAAMVSLDGEPPVEIAIGDLERYA